MVSAHSRPCVTGSVRGGAGLGCELDQKASFGKARYFKQLQAIDDIMEMQEGSCSGEVYKGWCSLCGV